MKDFKGKTAAITGAGSGIGRALAINLAQAGCNLSLSDVNAAGLEETCKLLTQYNVKVTTALLNVADRDAVFAWADKTAQDHGKIHMIFNNAGVALSGTVAGLSIEDYEWIMNINFNGVLYGTKAFLPYLEKSGEGHIINTSSIFGLASQPLMSGYNASKFAVRGLTESLRQDLEISGSCVSCSCVHPGGIKTNIAKAARMDTSCKDVTGASNEEATQEFEKLFITTPDKAAKTILKGVRNNSRRILIGPDARFFDLLVRLLPATYQRIFTAAVRMQSKKAAAQREKSA